jgi:site-specific DNA-methyltransferase (adenine-specific)
MPKKPKRKPYKVYADDCLDVLRTLPDDKIDALVTDPPAAINFMGREWDDDKGGRDHWIKWLAEIMRECFRVLKPGAHGLVWALPRTSHWTATALEDAGFEIRDVVTHLFGSGFPKSLDVSKAIDKAAGAERKVVGRTSGSGMTRENVVQGAQRRFVTEWNVTSNESITDAAKQWSGWGTALKPASEHWILVRKPLVGTVAANALAYGTGALNIDACRIDAGGKNLGRNNKVGANGWKNSSGGPTTGILRAERGEAPLGRWPANLTLQHSPGCRQVGTKRVTSSSLLTSHALAESPNVAMPGKNYARQPRRDYAPDGLETVEAWSCVESCAVRLLDEQSGETGPSPSVRGQEPSHTGEHGIYGTFGRVPYAALGDSGGASRFFYTAKASRSEREAGVSLKEHRKRANLHPTVKSLDLMRWLVKLVTPPNGIILDPFMGSGSTGCAALVEGFRFVGIEKDREMAKTAKMRLAHWRKERWPTLL